MVISISSLVFPESPGEFDLMEVQYVKYLRFLDKSLTFFPTLTMNLAHNSANQPTWLKNGKS